MRFRKRPVALYLVPVPELQHVPSQRPVVAVEQPPLVGGPASTAAGTRIRKTAGPPPSPRIAQVLALEAPTVDDLGSYLADPDAGVRRTAVATLVEHLPDGYSAVLLHALHDDATARCAVSPRMGCGNWSTCYRDPKLLRCT